MDFQILFFSTYELIVSLAFGLLTVFIVTRFINATLMKDQDAHALRSNTSTALFTGGMVLAVLILVRGSVLPSVDALRSMVLSGETITLGIVLTSLGYFLVFYLISMVVSILLIYATIQIHMAAIRDVDEIKEVKADNIAQAILLSGVLLGMTYFIHTPLSRFISSLVDYDSLETLEAGEIIESATGERLVVPPIRVSPDGAAPEGVALEGAARDETTQEN